jgi:hypothetical protein
LLSTLHSASASLLAASPEQVENLPQLSLPGRVTPLTSLQSTVIRRC